MKHLSENWDQACRLETINSKCSSVWIFLMTLPYTLYSQNHTFFFHSILESNINNYNIITDSYTSDLSLEPPVEDWAANIDLMVVLGLDPGRTMLGFLLFFFSSFSARKNKIWFSSAAVENSVCQSYTDWLAVLLPLLAPGSSLRSSSKISRPSST